MTKPLFVCLDLQRVFVTAGPLFAPRAGSALLECRRLLDAARRQHWCVAHCFLARAEGPFTVTGADARPVEGFEPLKGESVLERQTLSAYGHCAFESLMQRSTPNVLVAGLSASITLTATAVDAFDRGHVLSYAVEALAAQRGLLAEADDHEAVANDIGRLLGFNTRNTPRNALAATRIAENGEPRR